jgi:hypothetical protein
VLEYGRPVAAVPGLGSQAFHLCAGDGVVLLFDPSRRKVSEDVEERTTLSIEG